MKIWPIFVKKMEFKARGIHAREFCLCTFRHRGDYLRNISTELLYVPAALTWADYVKESTFSITVQLITLPCGFLDFFEAHVFLFVFPRTYVFRGFWRGVVSETSTPPWIFPDYASEERGKQISTFPPNYVVLRVVVQYSFLGLFLKQFIKFEFFWQFSTYNVETLGKLWVHASNIIWLGWGEGRGGAGLEWRGKRPQKKASSKTLVHNCRPGLW